MTAYTDTELQEIAVWLKNGLSATRIAVRFTALRGSPVSRNAIIGIVHRNGALKTIGFANPKGGRSGGRPRKSATGKSAANENTARKNPPVLPGKLARRPEASKQAAPTTLVAKPVHQPLAKPLSPRPARSIAGEGRLVVDGEIYRFKLPAPRPAAIGRQPHVAAMRFIDCLFNRCRAPLDLTLEADPENDAPGSRPGPEMLCCGLRTKALKSYCAYHQARFHRPVAEVV
ncbi:MULTISPECIES: GcrA cell cycle regulator [unclassified Mesorhizobium]|uniref:GcrA cell cycle regulator n=1 Tax=unclassified Mesorhizobium TaxID=325217 RepID=UPI0003CF7D6F|nr:MULTISPECIES: GcrA cell cycle regulator [unclassified Mesorhizobium]ESY54118.1 GcrA cell cycle regulator [Mesorhizobium sp. LNJC374B00]ESY59258.1 GcrA cell cycle regulator [Mesorhizobium sp. LNJC372A00]WJI79926.1 GcrA cell cycle regulator [Mesorhizobium sp. C374B]WJI86463.1 GcrA cell cycle regulator [Mesorhizobium sp. C372A]